MSLDDEDKKDSWCAPLEVDGKTIFGGAARNVRISRRGGMDNIIIRVARKASEDTLKYVDQSEEYIEEKTPPKLRRVK